MTFWTTGSYDFHVREQVPCLLHQEAVHAPQWMCQLIFEKHVKKKGLGYPNNLNSYIETSIVHTVLLQEAVWSQSGVCGVKVTVTRPISHVHRNHRDISHLCPLSPSLVTARFHRWTTWGFLAVSLEIPVYLSSTRRASTSQSDSQHAPTTQRFWRPFLLSFIPCLSALPAEVFSPLEVFFSTQFYWRKGLFIAYHVVSKYPEVVWKAGPSFSSGERAVTSKGGVQWVVLLTHHLLHE